MNLGVSEKKCSISIGYVLAKPEIGQTLKLLSPTFNQFTSHGHERLAIEWRGNLSEIISEIVSLDDFHLKITTQSEKIYVVEVVH